MVEPRGVRVARSVVGGDRVPQVDRLLVGPGRLGEAVGSRGRPRCGDPGPQRSHRLVGGRGVMRQGGEVARRRRAVGDGSGVEDRGVRGVEPTALGRQEVVVDRLGQEGVAESVGVGTRFGLADHDLAGQRLAERDLELGFRRPGDRGEQVGSAPAARRRRRHPGCAVPPRTARSPGSGGRRAASAGIRSVCASAPDASSSSTKNGLPSVRRATVSTSPARRNVVEDRRDQRIELVAAEAGPARGAGPGAAAPSRTATGGADGGGGARRSGRCRSRAVVRCGRSGPGTRSRPGSIRRPSGGPRGSRTTGARSPSDRSSASRPSKIRAWIHSGRSKVAVLVPPATRAPGPAGPARSWPDVHR